MNEDNDSSQPLSSTPPQTQAKKGTGLGLTLVKQVIERHGGMVSIHNLHSFPTASSDIESTGVELTLYLPLASISP